MTHEGLGTPRRRYFRASYIALRGWQLLCRSPGAFFCIAIAGNISFLFLLTVQWNIGSSSLSPSLIVELLGILLGELLVACTCALAYQLARGIRPSLSLAMRLCVASIPTIAGLSLLGACLLVSLRIHPLFLVAALYVFVLLFVAVPVALLEKKSLSQSIQRSVELSSEHRLVLFALLLALEAIPIALSALLDLVPAAWEVHWALLLIFAVVQVAFSLLRALVIFVTYTELRRSELLTSLNG